MFCEQFPSNNVPQVTPCTTFFKSVVVRPSKQSSHTRWSASVGTSPKKKENAFKPTATQPRIGKNYASMVVLRAYNVNVLLCLVCVQSMESRGDMSRNAFCRMHTRMLEIDNGCYWQPFRVQHALHHSHTKSAMNFHTKLVDVNTLTVSHRPSHIDHIYIFACEIVSASAAPVCAYRIVYANPIGLHHCVRGCRWKGAAQLAFFVTTNSRMAIN